MAIRLGFEDELNADQAAGVIHYQQSPEHNRQFLQDLAHKDVSPPKLGRTG